MSEDLLKVLSAEVKGKEGHSGKEYAGNSGKLSSQLRWSRSQDLSASQKSKDCTANNGALMPHTDRCLLHLARALVMNPEILVVHKPVMNFDRFHAKRILTLLREFVDL